MEGEEMFWENDQHGKESLLPSTAIFGTCCLPGNRGPKET